MLRINYELVSCTIKHRVALMQRVRPRRWAHRMGQEQCPSVITICRARRRRLFLSATSSSSMQLMDACEELVRIAHLL